MLKRTRFAGCTRWVLAVTCLGGATITTAGEKPGVEPLFDLGFVSTAMSEDAALREGMGTRGYGLELCGGVLLQHAVSLTAEFAAEWHADEQPFWEDTTAGEMKSSVGTYQGALLVGLHSPDWRLGSGEAALAGVLKAGYAGFGGNRGIGNCVDCSSESVEVKGGLFVEPALVLHLRGRLGLGASYRIFGGSADARNAFVLRFGFM